MSSSTLSNYTISKSSPGWVNGYGAPVPAAKPQASGTSQVAGWTGLSAGIAKDWANSRLSGLQSMVQSTGRIHDQLHRSGHVRQFRGDTIKLTSTAPLPFELDGENIGPLPVTFTVQRRTLRVIVP